MAAKLYIGCKYVLEVQRWYGHPLSPEFGGAGTLHSPPSHVSPHQSCGGVRAPKTGNFMDFQGRIPSAIISPIRILVDSHKEFWGYGGLSLWSAFYPKHFSWPLMSKLRRMRIHFKGARMAWSMARTLHAAGGGRKSSMFLFFVCHAFE